MHAASVAPAVLAWVPVALRLPDDDVRVLVWCDDADDWYVAWHEGDDWFDAGSGGWIDGVAYWADVVGPND